jgi:MinD-like ATPase involved in chromosome partitioning or flagellar assembly
VTNDQAVLDAVGAQPSRRLDETRTLIAIGDPARERLVLQLLAEAIEDGPPLRLVRRCLDVDDLVGSIQSGEIDAAIVSADLHGFGEDVLRTLAQVRIPLVLWGVNSGVAATEALDGTRVVVLSREVDVAELRNAIAALTTTGGRLRRPSSSAAVTPSELERALMPGYAPLAPYAPGAARGGTVIALVGAPGGQGVSILAAGLTAALGQGGCAALVDLNLERPSQALALDLNPARNLYMVLHEAATRDDPSLWTRLLESELQLLDASVPGAVVLAGAPGGGLAAHVDADGVHRLLRHLTRHEQFVVMDVGSSLEGGTPFAAAHRAALDIADRVLVVTRSDVVALRRTAHLLDILRGFLECQEERLALVLNQHQRDRHHDWVEVARALRTTVAAVIPNDPRRVQAGLAAQRPLVAFGGNPRGSAGQALVELARQLRVATNVQPANAASRSIRLGFTWPRTLWPLAWQGRRP